ncbi:TniQ family protein [Acinetobacter seifertii]|uniref:TniQ family protein n=1 Tax=Acinetobacter seifertii TaxID=1530123 RepID=UPI000C229C9A|nr:TniQ family protein [Acinetobacter seifertii]PJG65500.1 hypothetical protein CVD09_15840 [Acinetobacter seifertii]
MKNLFGESDKFLPIHPKPCSDELLSSWMLRLAHANSIKAHTLYSSYFGHDKQIWNRDIDVLAPEWLIHGLMELSGATFQEVYATTLKKYEGYVYDHIIVRTNTHLLLSQGIYHRLRRLHGLQYCPSCLAENHIPYFRSVWRLAFYTVCPLHNCLLRDSCPNCDAPIIIFRGDIGYKNEVTRHSVRLCHQCLTDLTKEKKKCWNAIYTEVYGAMSVLLDAPNKGFTIHPLPIIHYSQLFFKIFRQILMLLISARSNPRARFNIVDLEKDLKINNDLADFANKTKRSFESLRHSERHYLVQITLWLLCDWPYRIKYYVDSWKVIPSLIMQDMKYRPYLFESMFRDW